jgi:hypothetical protein
LGLVLGFVRFDILQPDLILTATPTRRSSGEDVARCVRGACSAFGLEYPEADQVVQCGSREQQL